MGLKKNEANKISLDLAKKEVSKWLDHKKVSDSKISELKEQKKIIESAISDGDLYLDESFYLVQKLKFEVLDDDNNPFLTELKYKPRLRVDEIEAKQKHMDSTTAAGVTCSYVSALTGESSALIKKIDTEDNKIAQAICMFFL